MPGGHLKRQASQMTPADVPGLVGDLKKAAYEEKEKIAHLVDILAIQVDTNPRALVSAGAIKPLIELVKSGNDGSQVHAASALATIAAAKYEFQDKIIQAGAIVPLVSLLHMGSNVANSFAAAAIASLSDQPKHRGEIVKAGACRPLVRLVRDDVTVDTQLHASDAIADLSCENKEAQDIFHASGAVPLLLALLKGGKANTAAARALAKMLSPLGESFDSSANLAVQQEISQLGGIAPLLALLGGLSADTQVYAAEALSNLARGNAPNQAAIAKAGGVKPLLALLQTKAQAQAASALGQLAKDQPKNQELVAYEGGLPLLSSLLSSNDALVQTMAAFSITEVCRHHADNQSEAADCGAIRSLVDLLKEGKEDSVKDEAAGAIWVLSEDHANNKKAIALAGGIEPTVGQLAQGTRRGQTHAEGALASLGLENVKNQTEITRLLVGLLSTGAAETKRRASELLWRLINDNPDTQEEMANAGSLTDIVGLLKDGNAENRKFALWSLSLAIDESNQKTLLEEEAVDPIVIALGSAEANTRRQAAAAIKQLAYNNSKAQLAIAKQGGVEPLVHIVKGGGPREEMPEEAPAPAGASPFGMLGGLMDSLGLTADSSAAAAEKQPGEAIAAAGAGGPGVSATDGASGVEGGAGGAAAAGGATTAAPGTGGGAERGSGGGGVGGSGGAETLEAEALEAYDGMEARTFAAAAVADIALLPKNAEQIVKARGVFPLVSLLKDPDGGAKSKQFAASALARLTAATAHLDAQKKAAAKKEEAKADSRAKAKGKAEEPTLEVAKDIARAGAIVPLVELLGGSFGDKAQEEAAGALYELASEVGNRVAITEAGGIGPLVTMLGSDNSTTQKHAKGSLVRLSIESENRALIIKKLVNMLSDRGSSAASAQEQAAAAVANLASESTENRVSIVDAGGIEPLLSLLESGTTKAKENSIAAISSLADSDSIRLRIADSGGIPLLAAVLATSSNLKDLMANPQLYSLAASALSKCATTPSPLPSPLPSSPLLSPLPPPLPGVAKALPPCSDPSSPHHFLCASHSSSSSSSSSPLFSLIHPPPPLRPAHTGSGLATLTTRPRLQRREPSAAWSAS